jgi:short/branched chain acyl-CoA dehydrogenase
MLRVFHRKLHSTPLLRSLPSLHTFTDEEKLLRDTVRKYAKEHVLPLVSKMDENELLDTSVLKGLFDQGDSMFSSEYRTHGN